MRGQVKAIEVALDRPTFDRQWMPGTYLVSGVFPIKWDPGEAELTYEAIIEPAPVLLAQVRENKQTIWPRGVAGFYVAPVFYQYGVVSEETIRAVSRHNQYHSWAQWYDPVVLDLEYRKVWMRREFANRRFVFWRKCLSLAFSALSAITLAEIGEATLTINDGEMNLPVKEPQKRANS